MSQWLTRKKRAGGIDFIKTDYKEFLGFDFETEKFFIIFYDNKYREDSINIKAYLESLNKKLTEYEKDLNTGGVFNTTAEYNKVKLEIDFIKKYE